jgi:hypothetical protein
MLRLFRIFGILLALVWVSACNMEDRGLSKLQVTEDLTLGSRLDDVKTDWFLYSTKALQVDQVLSTDTHLAYRGVSRDPSVTEFYFFFNNKTLVLDQVEWRYHTSMAESKEKELLDKWTKKLWPPSYQPRWNTHVYVWRDRKAKLELYVADGICHLVHQLN